MIKKVSVLDAYLIVLSRYFLLHTQYYHANVAVILQMYFYCTSNAKKK